MLLNLTVNLKCLEFTHNTLLTVGLQHHLPVMQLVAKEMKLLRIIVLWGDVVDTVVEITVWTLIIRTWW